MTKPAKIIAFPGNSLLPEQTPENSRSFNDEKTADFENEQLKSETLMQVELPVETNALDDSAEEHAKKPIRLDELTEAQLEKYAENFRLVKLIEEENITPAAAVRRTNCKRSPRAVAQLYKRYQAEGKQALIDWRWGRKPKTNVLTAPIKKLILNLIMAFPAAGIRGIQRLIKNEVERLKNFENKESNSNTKILAVPAVSTIHKYYKSLPEAVKEARTARGFRKYKKQGAPYTRYENTRNANERWQVDHTELAIWIRVRRKGKWKAVKVYLTLALDVHSRAITGFWLSTKYGDTWAIKIMLYFAIRPKTVKGWNIFGKPKIVQCDNGTDYISIAMRATLAVLGILMDVDHPYYPNSKGKIERVFRTLDTRLFRILPGHFEDVGVSEASADKRVQELYTRDQLKNELEKVVVEYNNTVHGETERKPQELWEETVIGPVLPEDHELNICLLQHDKKRTIQGFGIRFKFDDEKHLYWHPEFVNHWKEQVSLAYNPESLESVLVYGSTGKFICEAWDMRAESPHFKLSDVRTARKTHPQMFKSLYFL
jgi:putative transposase